MLRNILPVRVSNALSQLEERRLTEIRIRGTAPVVVDYGGRYYLGENGLVERAEQALVCDPREVQNIVFKACECSVYAHNEELKSAFIALEGGYRLGVCGELVIENGYVKTIKNFSSVNIRIPHAVRNCSLNALPYLHDHLGMYNTLIISPPGAGKTTFIRDLSYQLSEKYICGNILIVDERNEIASCKSGVPTLEIGKFVDVYSGSTKEFGLINGIRTMAPEAIILDEIATLSDIRALDYALGSGVKVIATAHSQDVNDLQRKPAFKNVLQDGIFKRFVVLSKRNGVGTIEGIFDEKNICLFCNS